MNTQTNELVSIPYPDEPGTLVCTKQAFESLVKDLGFKCVEYLAQQLEQYAEDQPKKFKKYKNHAAVIRKWNERKVSDGYVFSPSYGHYVKRWMAAERGEI